VDGGDDPAEKVLKTHKHQKILEENGRRRHTAKSLILRTYGVVASHSPESYPRLAGGRVRCYEQARTGLVCILSDPYLYQ